MSGLTIDHGGAISVDPQALRDVGTRIDAVASRFDEAKEAIFGAHRTVIDTPGFSASVDTVELWASGERMARLSSECHDAAVGTLLMADVYEYVELQAEAEALAIVDVAASDALYLRMERLAASDERIAGMAAMLVAGWESGRFEGLGTQFSAGGVLMPLFLVTAYLGTNAGRGKVPLGARLSGTADAVRITPTLTTTPIAPAGIAGALGRMPVSEGAQIAVEKYSFADGSTKFVAYLKGTQSPAMGGSEPWDMKSNLELYTNESSSSYQATLDALEAAGAQPGDEVDIVAHSQSGMIAAHMSMQSEYDVQVQITAGSPVEPTLRDDQTLIQLRHTDDPVSALAGGGSPGSTGSDDSVVISRVGDPIDQAHDLWLHTHLLNAYVETAAMADAAGDPRIEVLDEFWHELAQAEVIERTEYKAQRTG